MSKEWKLRDQEGELPESLTGFGLLLGNLMIDRGVIETDEINKFLKPAYEHLLDPHLFVEMNKAVNRIWKAIQNQEKIVVFGDYDADAVTANAVLQHTFRYLGVDSQSYIPDRFAEGYGLNLEAFEKFKSEGVNLVITVDCGTNSVEVADFCCRNGIDLVITDHHEITGDIPKAYALINPKNPKETYPEKQITGVGVAFKLVQGLLGQTEKVERRLSEHGKSYVVGWEKWLLDLVAIGTVADCHSLMGENRILVTYGLKVLSKTRWLGLRLLMEEAGVDLKTIDTMTLGFVLAPRINAAGRLEHANIALSLLTSEDFEEAVNLAKQLQTINTRRQDLTARMVSEAKEHAILQANRPVLVLADKGWSKGVVGLVAGRLTDSYARPVIALEQGDVESTGSVRGFADFDVIEMLKDASDVLLRFGGHKQAAGLTLLTANLPQFKKLIWEHAEIALKERPLVDQLLLDFELRVEDLKPETIELINLLEPYGFGNPRPKFLLRSVKVNRLKAVGEGGKHIQMTILKENIAMDTITFNQPFLAQAIQVGDIIHIAGELQLNNWGGRKKLKMRVIDVKKGEEEI